MSINAKPLELTRDEILEQIEAIAQKKRSMSGPDLIRAHRAGLLEDPDEVFGALVLADLLPKDDPLK
jgi:hypothetical protein